MTIDTVLQWVGFVVSVTGSYFVSKNDRRGWFLFLIANLLWIAYGFFTGAWGLLLMNVCFFYTSLNGIKNNYFKKKTGL